MKQILLATSFACFVLAGARVEGQTNRRPPIKVDVVIEGTVLNISPPTPVSGLVFYYRLVKYRVERVCKGKYAGAEIIVDHQIIAGSELDDVKVGDRVGVAVRRAESVAKRWDAEGIRDPSDVIKVFYVGGGVSPARDPVCSCLNEAIHRASFFNLKKRY
jgi:hypothetical protein